MIGTGVRIGSGLSWRTIVPLTIERLPPKVRPVEQS
jgi:hypothetical protein